MMATPIAASWTPKAVVPSCHGSHFEYALDGERQQCDEHRSQHRSDHRTHAADDDHGKVNDSELERYIPRP